MLKLSGLYLTVAYILFSFSCSKSEMDQEPDLPTLSINNVTHERDDKDVTLYRFNINVRPASNKEITVSYNTLDGTAKSDVDYNTVEGTLTIPANQTSGYIDVNVTADSLRQAEQTFYVQLDSPVNAKISGNGKGTGTIQNDGTYFPVDGTGYSSSEIYPGMSLAWSDEFDGSTLDNSSWTREIGGWGWGNNELEYYTNSTKNSFTSEGYLVIEARKETNGSNNYTSARIISKDKRTFTYGRIDIRAKLPKGQGIWPALWMLGNNISQVSWPACGEIDIMELLGHEPKKSYGTIHWGPAGGGSTHIGGNYVLPSGDFSDSFHVFSLLWETDKFTFMVDDNVFYTADKNQVNGDYPFDKPFFFIMNVAVGGNWPGNPDGTTVFPQRMIVDFVRVFQ
jgi:hypothetical protein